MELVLLSVLCSVTVSVMLKLARMKGLETTQIIVWNYPAAGLLTFLFFRPEIEYISDPQVPWTIYFLLAFLLPGVFLALGASIRTTGIVRTEVAQRLSLVIPLIAAFSFFGEKLTTGTSLGLAIGLVAIFFSIGWHKTTPGQHRTTSGKHKTTPVQQGENHSQVSSGQQEESRTWIYPLLVFFGYGICDILFKRIAQITAIPYTTSMFFVFILAMLVAFAYLLYIAFTGKQRISSRAILWGLVLGGFNFANILFYMKAHRALPENPSVVFAGMNIGVISVGALVGILVFREQLSRLNRIGLLLALISVLVLAAFL